MVNVYVTFCYFGLTLLRGLVEIYRIVATLDSQRIVAYFWDYIRLQDIIPTYATKQVRSSLNEKRFLSLVPEQVIDNVKKYITTKI